MLEVRLIGAIEAIRDGGVIALPGRRPRALLAMLALSPGRAVPVDTLVRGVWDDDPPEHVRGALQTYVGRLRQLLGENAISTEPSGYALRVPRAAVDLSAFDDAVTAAVALEDESAERTALAEATARCQGAPFGDPPSEWIARHEVPAWNERYLQAVERRVDLDLAAGRHLDCLAELSTLGERHPLRETLWSRLLVALDRAGRTAEALERYESVRKRLAEELGVDPSPELRAVYSDLLARADESVTAPAPRTRQVPRLLPAVVRGFVGRAELLGRLDELLAEPESSVLALHGPPGSGKTTLAVRWAHQVAERFPDGQVYLNLQGFGPGAPLDAARALERMLQAVGVNGSEMPLDLDGRVAVWRSAASGRRMLVVLDNASDSDIVRTLIPGSDCVVLVTSRNQLRSLATRDGARRIAVDRMSPAESVDLLARRIEREASRTELTELAELCDHLPIALAVAAERVDRAGHLSVAALRDELRSSGRRLGALSLEDDPSTNVYAVLNWTYESLDDETARLFRRLGLHEQTWIHLGAAAAYDGVDLAHAERLLDRLVNHHLVTQTHSVRYELHDLVREFAHAIALEVDPAGERTQAERRRHSWMLHSARNARDVWKAPSLAPPEAPEPLAGVEPASFDSPERAAEWVSAHAGDIAALIERAVAVDDPLGYLLAPVLLLQLDSLGMLRHKRDLLERVEASAGRIGDDVGRAEAANMVGGACFDAGDYQGILDAAGRAGALYAALGSSEGQVIAHANEAAALYMMGRIDESVAAYERVVGHARTQGQLRRLGVNLGNLSELYTGLGRHDDAIRAAEECVSVHREARAPIDDLASGLHVLAKGLAASGERMDAMQPLEEAIELTRCAQFRVDEVCLLHTLGTLQRDLGETAAARRTLRDADRLLDDLGTDDARGLTRADLRELIASLA